MDMEMLKMIANYYSLQEWQGIIHSVNNGRTLQKFYQIEFNDGCKIIVGYDNKNAKSVWIAFHNADDEKLEAKAVLFQ